MKQFLSFFFLIASAALLYINKYIYENKYNGWLYTDLRTSEELYSVNDKPYISHIKKTNVDSIIRLQIEPEGKSVLIKLKDGVSNYRFRLKNEKEIKLRIGLTPLSVYSQIGNTENTSSPVNIIYSNVPIVNNLPYNITDWTTPVFYFSKNDVIEVDKLLREEVLINKFDSTPQKIKKIATFLNVKLDKAKGVQEENINPYSLYTLAGNGKTKIWCTGISDIYHLFATIAGIPTRKVGFTGRMDEVYLAAHAFCESYIAERGEWAFVDLTTSNITPYSIIDFHYINTVELHTLLKSNITNHIRTLSFNRNSLDTVSFGNSRVEIQQRMFFNKNSEIVYRLPVTYENYYSTLGKIKRYLGIINVRVTYIDSTFQKDNLKHFLKIIFLLFSVLILGIQLRSSIRNKN